MKCRCLAACITLLMCSTCLSGCGRKQIQIQELPVLNYTVPAQGEEIVVMTVRDYGEIKIRLFPELLPQACENFITLAGQGYYDGLTFHRVIQNFMIQSGDPLGDSSGGESCWGGYFDGGVSDQLIHVAGALAYANSNGSTATDGSQFYIVTGQQTDNAFLDDLVENHDMYFTAQAREYYTEYGGIPYLDGSYTVFGQVIDGLDIVFQISQTPTDSSDKPEKAIYIESVRTEPYDSSQICWFTPAAQENQNT